jgi:hypothetical protein
MAHRSVRLATGVAILTLSLTWAAPAARADLTILSSSTTGGPLPGAIYTNFNNFAVPSNATQTTTTGVVVSFSGSATTANTSDNTHARPYINTPTLQAAPFGNPQGPGPDLATYLSTGIGSVTMTLPGTEHYFGVLWGSVDAYNTLSFFNGATLVGSVTGSQVLANPVGDTGPAGTVYANFGSIQGFTSVVATSSQLAFEFDNIAFSPNVIVPEPSTFALAIVGAAGMIAYGRRRRKDSTAS